MGALTDRPMTRSELCGELNLKWTTAYDVVMTLVDEGDVRKHRIPVKLKMQPPVCYALPVWQKIDVIFSYYKHRTHCLNCQSRIVVHTSGLTVDVLEIECGRCGWFIVLRRTMRSVRKTRKFCELEIETQNTRKDTVTFKITEKEENEIN
jgi:hypothetical protein